MVGDDMHAAIDFAVSYAGAPSHAKAASKAYGVVAGRRAQSKRTKYGAQAQRLGQEMVPFAMESSGAMDAAAVDLLGRLAARRPAGSRAAFLYHYRTALSVAIQKGNAAIAAAGLTMLRRSAGRRAA